MVEPSAISENIPAGQTGRYQKKMYSEPSRVNALPSHNIKVAIGLLNFYERAPGSERHSRFQAPVLDSLAC